MNWFAEEWSSLRSTLDQAVADRDFRGAAILGEELCHYPLVTKDWAALAEVAEITAAAANSTPVGNVELVASQMLGIALQQMGDAVRATDAFHRVLALAGETDWSEQAPALAHLGQLALDRHDPHEAATLLRRAALLYRRAGSVSGEALTLGNLAPLLRDLGAFDEASAANRRALDLFAQAGNRVWEARTLLCVARDQFRNREATAGRASVVTALHMFEELALDADVIETQFMLAQVDFQLDNKPSALAFAQAALSAAQATDHPDAAVIEAFLESLVWGDAVQVLLQATTFEEREAAVTRYPVLLRPHTVRMLAQQRDESDGEVAEALDAGLEFLLRYRGGLHEHAVDRFWEHLCRLASDRVELPANLREILSRCQDTGDPDERISLLEVAISMVPAEELALVRGCLYYNLAGVCWKSLKVPIWQRAERAIEYAERALSLFDRNSAPVEWAEAHGLLGTLWRQLPPRDHTAHVDRSLCHLRSALAVFRRNRYPEEWAGTLINLGNAYRERRDGDRRWDLRRAIARHRSAQTVFTQSEFPVEWASLSSNIGLSLMDEALANDPANLERARTLLLDVLEVPGISASLRATVEANLALCYSQRRDGDPDQNWHTQMRHNRAAYQAFEKLGESFEMAKIASHIGSALRHRPDGASGDDTEEAIEWFEQALSLVSLDDAPLFWAGVVDNLACAYARRVYGPRLENLLHAIVLHGEALAVYGRHSDPFEEARAWFNFAMTMLDAGPAEDLDRAADLLERSLRLRPREVVPLAWAESARHLAAVYRRRATLGGRSTELRDAANLLAQIVDGIDLENFPNQAERTFREFGHVQADLGDWSAAAQSWLRAIGAGDRLYRASLLRQTQESALSRTSGLPRLAAYAFARSGDTQTAVTVLERGRCRLLGERLSRDRADLTAVAAADRTLFMAYEDAANRIRGLESRAVERPVSPAGSSPSSGTDTQGAMADARAQLDTVVAAIRRLPGHESFLVEPDFGVIAEAVTTDLPVAYLITTEHGSVVLLVHVEVSTGGVVVESLLGELREGDFLAAVASYPDTGSMDDLDRRLRQLLLLVGERLLAPVAARLNELGAKAIAFVATGILSELPLQAASYEREGRVIYLLDEFDVHYAPSARVLAAARAAATRAAGQPLLAGVGNPQPTDVPLPYAHTELDVIASMLAPDRCRARFGEAADREGLLADLSGATHVHLACHGYYDFAEPSSSALALGKNTSLTLEDLMRQQLFAGVRLVVASACESAVTEIARLPDEAVGLPAGFLQSGAAAVIGSLWRVDDISTALLMTYFYRLHLLGEPASGEPPMPPGRALATAQRWLRDLTAEQLEGALERLPHSVQTRLREPFQRLQLLEEPSDTHEADLRPFADHPTHWAAFVMVGL